MSVPDGFLEGRTTAYELEVLALEVSRYQTISAGFIRHRMKVGRQLPEGVRHYTDADSAGEHGRGPPFVAP